MSAEYLGRVDRRLTIRQLSERYGVSKSFWRNRIKRGHFVRNVHYFQPHPGGPIVFSEREIEKWWRGQSPEPVETDAAHNELIEKLLA